VTKTGRRRIERVAEAVIAAAGMSAVVAVALVSAFLFIEAVKLFGPPEFDDETRIDPASVFAGTDWYPISEPPRFGIVPLFLGSAWVSLGALVIAVPLGVASALYIGEVAPRSVRELLKPLVEILAAIPSVVIGFIGLELVSPAIARAFSLQSGLCALTGSVALAIMALPTIVTVAEDAIVSVPRAHREASLALGANRWQTSWRVVLPAAAPGVFAGVILGVGRVVGETMAVLMVTGNAAVIPSSLLEPVRTMTATVAAEMGETVHGSQHYSALFMVATVLFAMTLALNGCAAWFLARTRLRAAGKV